MRRLRSEATRNWSAALLIGVLLIVAGGLLLGLGAWLFRSAVDEFRAVTLDGVSGAVTVSECEDPQLDSPVVCTGDFAGDSGTVRIEGITMSGLSYHERGDRVPAAVSGADSDTAYPLGRWAWLGWFGVALTGLFVSVLGLGLLTPVLLTAYELLKSLLRWMTAS